MRWLGQQQSIQEETTVSQIKTAPAVPNYNKQVQMTPGAIWLKAVKRIIKVPYFRIIFCPGATRPESPERPQTIGRGPSWPGMVGLAPKLVRLALNGTNPWLFRSDFSAFGAPALGVSLSLIHPLTIIIIIKIRYDNY